MTETIDEKVLTEIEKELKLNHVDGVIVIKKSQIKERTQKLVDGINNYLKSRGYDTLIKEDDLEYHVSLILKPF